MKYLFVSPEKVSQDQYRHGPVFRLAGVLLLLGVVLQVPVLFWGVLSWKQFRDRNAEETSLRIELSELQKADVALKEIRQKLAQIRQWEPILNNRIPVSSLLNAIQVSIPQNAVLDTISIEAEQFDRLPVVGGMYRVPRAYRLVLQGLERPGGETHCRFSATIYRNVSLRVANWCVRNGLNCAATGVFLFFCSIRLNPPGTTTVSD